MPRRPPIRAALAALGVALLPGCMPVDLERGGTGPQAPAATLLGTVPVTASCDQVGVIDLQLRAFRIGCDPLSNAPCTLPAQPEEVPGDRYSCPATEDTHLLGVDVHEGGVYLVDVAVHSTAGPQEPDCYTLPDGREEIPVTAGDVEAGAQIALVVGQGPCQQR